MSDFFKENRVEAFTRLGDFLLNPNDDFKNTIESAKHKNAWFSQEQVLSAINANGQMLNKADLLKFTANIPGLNHHPKNVGLILAGNIPLVGFHDILTVLLTGNIAVIKLSSQDDLLIPYILSKLVETEPNFKNKIQFVEKLESFDAVIATGSNNSSRYFDHYFSKVPNIIRKNRNSVALLTGKETTEDLKRLGADIFNYYGLGCRNVSKLFVPEGYVFKHFFESIEEFSPIINHHKYNNNYDYNKSIFLINKNQHFDNGFLLVAKDDRMVSPLATVYYQEYQTLGQAIEILNNKANEVQVVVSSVNESMVPSKVSFGESQNPKLWDFADGVDTISFLNSLNRI
ncbi:acyl-CoA reductase [Pedobacter sp. SD-b]|uniref:Acyl-CoA reductase n=1 Tax=Pedobacter segetis TaxID=2793069 RepID=A0ABS1BHW5_9SPHI|nr:acyl-CoA reductase [Pedobacter segetis]MBK0382454.1 acyl-CoA reductase [Pedobacter segetis]